MRSKRIPSANRRKRIGFTLLEILVVLGLMALLVGLSVRQIASTLASSRLQEAVDRAKIIDVYKGRYLTENRGEAQTAWASAPDDEAKYALIRHLIPNAPLLLGDGTTSGHFSPKGYQIHLNGISSASTVTRLADGESVTPHVPGVLTYTVDVFSQNTSMGLVFGGGGYHHGENVTVTAQPTSGHLFVRWEENGTPVSLDATYTFILTSNRTLTAKFMTAPVGTRSLTVNKNSSFAGSVTPSSGSYPYGDSVSLVASPNINYVFDHWSGDIGDANPRAPAITVVMDQDRVVQANFVRVSVRLDVVANNPSYGSVSGGGDYPSGHSVSVVATPYPGFRFIRWMEGMTPLSTSPIFSYTVNDNTTLTAEFDVEPSTGVTAGSYGNASNVPRLTIDAQGRVLSAENIQIQIHRDNVDGLGTLAQQNANNVNITGGTIMGVSFPNVGLTGSTITASTINGSTINSSNIGMTDPGNGRFVELFLEQRFRIQGNSTLSGYGGVEMVNEAGYGLKIASARYGFMDSTGTIPRFTIDNSGHGMFYSSFDFNGRTRVKDTFEITNTAGPQKLIMGNQDSAGTNTPTILTAANGALEIGTGNSWAAGGGGFTSRFYFGPDGRMGIGTLTPSQKLDVQGNARIAGNVHANEYYSPFVGMNSGNAGDPYSWGYQEKGEWTFPYPDLVMGYHTGMKFGANKAYGGMRFYADHPTLNPAKLFSIGEYDDHVRVTNNLYVGGSLVLSNQGSGSGIDADLLDGYNTSKDGTPDTVVVRDSYGNLSGYYGYFHYLNMDHPVSYRPSDTVFYSSDDNFVRKNNAEGFRAALNVPTRTGDGASGTWPINVTGSAGSVHWDAVSSKPSRGDYWGRNNIVVEMLSWRQNGNGHVVFDASSGYSPDGTALAGGNVNAQVPWSAYYPTLMGWNGSATYGVRVDSARVADWASTVGSISYSQVTGALGFTPVNKAGDTITGELAVGGTFTLGTNIWHRSTDGYVRYYFGHAGRTYFRAYDGYSFQNSSGSDVVQINNAGQISAVSINTTSARRFKEDIQSTDAHAVHEKVLNLRPVTYRWKEGMGKGGDDFGFIAEEVNEYFPEIIGRGDDGEISGMDYSRLTAALVDSVKVLSKENGEMKLQIDKLMRKVENEKKESDIVQYILIAALIFAFAISPSGRGKPNNR